MDASRRWAILALWASCIIAVTIAVRLRPHLRHDPSPATCQPDPGQRVFW